MEHFFLARDYPHNIISKAKDRVSHILFIYLGFYIAFNTVQVISRWVVGRAEETSTYSSLGSVL